MLRAILLALLPLPALAGVTEAVEEHVVPGFAAFAAATRGLADAAEADCTGDALRMPYEAAWDAWAPVADVRLGPSEAAALSIAFWPDERGAAARTLGAMVAAEDPAGLDPTAFAEGSVAARGLMALDQLLHGDVAPGYGPGSYACALVQTVTADLAAQAAVLGEAWAEHAVLLETAGAAGNASYLTEDEAFRALYTQVLGGLEFTADQRLGRPLGDFDRPWPTRAEAWRSGRPLANALAAAEGAGALAHHLADGPLPATEAALEVVRVAAGRVRDPSFQDIADPQARLLVEILQERVRALKDAVEAEVGQPRGIAPGFNSQDGD